MGGALAKVQDGQTQRVDIVLPEGKTLDDAREGYATLLARFDLPEPTLLSQFSFTDPVRGRTFLPVELRVIDSNGESDILFSLGA